MLKTRMFACLALGLMLFPMASALGASPHGKVRNVSHMGGCDSCGCDVPCAAPCGDCCDPCGSCCVPLIPALLHRIDSALQRVFCCHCYDPCGCGLNCWDCAGCSGGYDGGCSSCGGGGGCSSCGGGAGPEVLSGRLSPVPRMARMKQAAPRGPVTRGVSSPRPATAAPATRTTKSKVPARVKTAATSKAAPIDSNLEEEVGSQVQRTSYSSSKPQQPKNPLR